MTQYPLHFFQKIDVFGVDTNLRFQESKKFTSKFGGFITLLLIGVLCSLFSQQVIDISQSESPNFLLEEHVEQSIKYEINSDNFQFMIALLKNGKEPVVDANIFKFSAILYQQQDQMQSDNNIKSTEQQIQLELNQCSKVELDKIPNQSFFLQANYHKFLCLTSQTRINFVQNLNQNSFLQIFINECTDSVTCSQQKDRRDVLDNASVQIYFTNPFLSLQNYNLPLQQSIKTLKYSTIKDFTKDVQLLFTKAQVIDDKGLFVMEKKITEAITFNQDDSQVINKENDVIFKIKILFDSEKENRYFRNYVRVPSIFAFLGGIFNVLFFICGLILKPYNNHQFERTLLSQVNQQQALHQNKQRFLNRANSNDYNQSKMLVINTPEKSSIYKQGVNFNTFNFRNNSNVDNYEDQKQKTFIESFKDDLKSILLTFFSCFYCFCLDMKEKMGKEQEQINYYLNIVSYINIFKLIDGMNDKLQDSILKSKQEIQNDIKQLMSPSIATNHEKLLPDDSFLIDNKLPKFHSDYIQKSEACVTLKREEIKLNEKQEIIKIPLKEQLSQYKQNRQRAKSASKIPQNSIYKRPFFQKLNLQKVELEGMPNSVISETESPNKEDPLSVLQRKRQKSNLSPLPFEYLKNSFEFKVVSPVKVMKSSNLKDSCKVEAPSESFSPIPIYKSLNPKLLKNFNHYDQQIQPNYGNYSKTTNQQN